MADYSKADFLLNQILNRQNPSNRILYTSGADFTLPGGGIFFIEVPSGGGSVRYTTEGGQINTETMSAGYHPTAFTKIHSATAINLVIVF